MALLIQRRKLNRTYRWQ